MVNQSSFIDFMNSKEHYGKEISIEEFIFSVYQKFVSERLITYENFKLEDKYPEFRFQYEEYRDAMLLLQITKQKIWLKAELDNSGLQIFFTENKNNYMLERENKSLDEVFSVVQVDYQNYLMNKWVEGLRSKYHVKINEEVLSNIK